MANISKLTVDNTTYDIKDDTSRTSITNLSSYSLNETEIGTWVNNQKLYRKVISADTALSNGDNYIPHNITNLAYCTYAFMFSATNGYIFPIFNSSMTAGDGILQVNNTNVRIRCANDSFVRQQFYIILEYVKNS